MRRSPRPLSWSPRHLALAGSLAVACGAIAARPAWAQRPTPRSPAVATTTLTLDAIYQRLDRSSPQVAGARAEAAAAAARVSSQRTLPDPRMQLGVMDRELPSLRPMEVLGMNQLQVMQMVPLGGKLGLAGRAASARARAAAGRIDVRLWDARSEAAMAFYDFYAADRQLAVAEESRELLRTTAASSESMYGTGQGAQADVLLARLDVTRMTEDLVRMRAMRTQMAARLSAVLDIPVSADTLTVRIPRPPAALPEVDSLVGLALATRPMLAVGREELVAAQVGERLAKRELVPDVEIGFQVSRRPGFYGTMVGDEPPTRYGADWMGSFMIGTSIPIFARSRQLAMRDEASSMRQMAEQDVRGMAAGTRGRVREVAAGLARARELHGLYVNTLLPQATATRDAAEAAYRGGRVAFMVLMDAHMTVNRIRQELYVLRADEGKAIAELEMLVGRPLLDPAALLPIVEETR